MTSVKSALYRIRFAFLMILMVTMATGALHAQLLFSFNVDDLEAYDRSGNWTYDADGPTFPTHDGNWLTFSPAPAYAFHYFSEKYIHEGLTTSLTCIGEFVDQADNPGQLTMTFTQFNLVSFKRINTVNPLMPWNIPGQSGDERVYANAGGYISYNGTPVLYMTDATFVITTPYPNQAQVQALSPVFVGWTGDIGTGAPQTGYGYGDLDLVNSDPAWIPLFASSNYKIELQMAGITSVVTPTAGYFDFTLNVLPATTPYTGGNVVVDLGNLPEVHPIPGTDASLKANAGTGGGQTGDMLTLFLSEIGVPPSGTIPGGFNYATNKHWELGGTMQTFNVDVSLTLDLDDEGVPGRRVDIIKDGILKDQQTSRHIAHMLGLEPSSNMKASYADDIPLVRMTNLCLAPGHGSLAEMIEATEHGYLLDFTKTWSIDDNRNNFQFTTEIGYRIDDGKITGIVKEPTYFGITKDFWNACDRVCGEQEWKFHGTFGCGKGEPGQAMLLSHGVAPARFRNINVSVKI